MAARSLPCEAEMRTETILDLAPITMVGVGLDSRITEWNRHAAKMYGWSRSEAIGMASRLLVPERDRDEYRHMLQRWLSSDDEGICETPVKAMALHREGNLFPIEFNVLQPAGPRSGLVYFVRDLTERRQLQTDLLESRQR